MKLKAFLIKSISLYQRFVSPLLGNHCKFYPTCSEYTKQAIEKHGAIIGLAMGSYRIFRCHPWQRSHLDPLK